MITTPEVMVHDLYETSLLMQALQGDRQAASKALKYLSSADSSLRQIMQDAIHASDMPGLWNKLLNCLALHRWDGQTDCDRRSDMTSSQRIDQSIIEIFVRDISDQEAKAKEEALRQGLGNSEYPVRQTSAYLLALRGDTSVISFLEEAIQTGNRASQLRAIHALAKLKDEQSGYVLVEALAMDRDELHQAAKHALTELGKYAEPAFLQALEHPDRHIRWHAARGLGLLGNARGVHMLAEGLRDESQPVRWASACILASLGADAVPAILTQLSYYKLDEPFRQAAYHALHTMPPYLGQERLKPLLEALQGPVARFQAPIVAQNLLLKWSKTEIE